MTPTDPQPIINPYRILTFIIFVISGLSLLQVIPQNIKDWLPVVSLIVSGALTVFFGTPSNPSIVTRISNRSEKKQA